MRSSSPSSEANVPFLEDVEGKTVGNNRLTGWGTSRKHGFEWWKLACVVSVLLVTNAVTFFLLNTSWSKSLDRACALYTQQDSSPVTDEVDISYTTTRFNGSLIKKNIYREAPSPEVDEAWQALGVDYKPIVVPPEGIESYGVKLDRFKVPEEYDGPGYPAYIEVFHQLHCLDLLRKGLYFNVDYYRDLGKGPFQDKEEMLQSHIGHCLDMLRQRLMCTADIGLLPFIWAGTPPHVHPDFNREFKCRNFDDIRAYAERHQSFALAHMEIMPDEGSLVLPDIP